LPFSSCIATGTTVLVHAPNDSSPITKNAGEIANTVLSKLPTSSTSQKCTYTHSNYHLHTKTSPSPLLTEPLVFVLVTSALTPKAIAYNFLVETETQFLARFTLNRVDTARSGELETEFGVTLKNLMARFGNTKDIAKEVRGELDNVRGIMSENIERVMERGDRIELLVDKTNRLEVGAQEFRRKSKGLNRRMWWKNVKINILLGFVVLFLIYLFIGFGCGLPGKLESVKVSLWTSANGEIGWSKCLS
jgi:vesicle-associated membrane protein 7